MDVHPTKNVSIGIDPYPYGPPRMALFNSDMMFGSAFSWSQVQFMGVYIHWPA